MAEEKRLLGLQIADIHRAFPGLLPRRRGFPRPAIRDDFKFTRRARRWVSTPAGIERLRELRAAGLSRRKIAMVMTRAGMPISPTQVWRLGRRREREDA